MTRALPRASVVINNYNYGRFLEDAIESALAQTYSNSEVIVVDDGSTDNSEEIIRRFGNRVVPLLKENGGQGSAFNAGFSRSEGDIVLFLDADDFLRPTALERAAPFFRNPSVVKAQWQLTVVDSSGALSGRQVPREPPPSGNLWSKVVEEGPDLFAWSPGGGTVWSRAYLAQVLPAPEDLYQNGVDNLLFQLAPFFGRIETLSSSESFYRQHDDSDSKTIDFEAKLRRQVAFFDDYSLKARRYCEARGVTVDSGVWRANSWWCRLQRAANELDQALPRQATFILADEDSWGVSRRFRMRRVIPFTEREGEYWGRPPDDASALEELERLREAGADYLAVAWPSFWILEHFPDFREALEARFSRVLANSRLKIFSLQASS